MTIDDAARELNRRYFGADGGQKVVQIHLFGIEFADQIASMSMTDLAVRAGLPKSYGVELNKGANLAAFVRLR